jgi:hypothetical protein
MSHKYKFYGYYGEGVECPELDALVTDIEAVLAKHGVAYRREGEYEGSDRIVLVPVEEGDFSDVFLVNLDDWSRDIPWVRRAHDECVALEESRRREEREKRKQEIKEVAAREEAKLRANGLIVNGKRYRLVPDA